ncbi:RN166-like protein [Mya arenaria]|uniref:RN166-like protein n=1 Tax=Mya arenaria TaxID=6604 RepID=A0ABY7ERQ4_MYAAR|nr:RN166-like protein [Mya arenaria]
MASSEELSIEMFTCSICREIFKDPVTIKCGNNHSFCRECVNPLMIDARPHCPTCRQEIKQKTLSTNKNMSTQMMNNKLPCFGCNEKILITELNNHFTDCDKIDKSITYFKPVKETSQRIPTDLPNRATFKCPYCDLGNLDTRGLREHCNEKHRYDSAHVVCPVCASMPWGNQRQASSDFMAHLNMRHKFDYETYVLAKPALCTVKANYSK